jgi:Fe-S cluster assembly scaffold protein SufB
LNPLLHIKDGIWKLNKGEEQNFVLENSEYDKLNVHLSANAALTLVVQRKQSHRLVHEFEMEEACYLRIFYINSGGNDIVQQIRVTFAGENSVCELYGLCLARNNEKASTQVQVLHNVKNCKAKQLFKAVADHEAQVSFTGKILVASDAQKTEAYQTSKNLLLSSAARIVTQPQLEIYADDVKCSHGAAVGQLDPEALFYLYSRGIGKSQAQQMLLQAFAQEILEQIPERLPWNREFLYI